MPSQSEKLAALGGRPVLTPEDTRMGYPFITQEDKDAVTSVLDGCNKGELLWGTGTPQIRGAEQDWADYLGLKHCLLTNLSLIHI